jgi:IS605 OrfB family transposase
VAEGIGTLVIGKNPLWKQAAHLGQRTNQHVVSMPHARFIAMLAYKAELVGIQVKITEESYTSKASFRDLDSLPIFNPTLHAPTFSGRRVKRGLYRAADGRLSNAVLTLHGGSSPMGSQASSLMSCLFQGCCLAPEGGAPAYWTLTPSPGGMVGLNDPDS